MPNPPKPTVIRLLQGNPGKQALNKQEPKPEPGIPSAPRILNKAARAEWRRLCKQLYKLGLLTHIDRAALAMYCQAWGRWVEAEEKVAKTDLIVKAPISGHPMQNPYLSVANKAMRQCHSLLLEFGMTPSSRSRIKAGAEIVHDPFEDLLKSA